MTQQDILKALEAKEIDVDTAADMLAELNAAAAPPISFKVSEKGACSAYGLQRLPVTLYPPQWERLIDAIPRLREFLAAHKGEFSTGKADSKARGAAAEAARKAAENAPPSAETAKRFEDAKVAGAAAKLAEAA